MKLGTLRSAIASLAIHQTECLEYLDRLQPLLKLPLCHVQPSKASIFATVPICADWCAVLGGRLSVHLLQCFAPSWFRMRVRPFDRPAALQRFKCQGVRNEDSRAKVTTFVNRMGAAFQVRLQTQADAQTNWLVRATAQR